MACAWRGWWLCCVLAPLAACGGSAPEAVEPAGTAAVVAVEASAPPAPLSLLPADTFAVLRLDLERLRQSPYWPTIDGWLDDAEASAAEAGQPMDTLRALRDTLNRATVLVVGFIPPAEPSAQPEPVVVARGRFDGDALAAFVRDPRDPQTPVRTEQRRGFEVFVGPRTSGAQIGEHTWLIGSAPHLDAMLGRVQADGGPLASDRLRAMAERVELSTATGAFAMEVLPEIRGQMRRRMMGPAAGAEEAAALGARIELSSGIDLLVLAEMQGEAAAAQLAQRAEGFLDGMASSMVVRAMGVSPVFQGTSVTTAGATAQLTTRLDDATTRDLLDRLGSFVRLALQAAVAEAAGELSITPARPAGPQERP